MTQESKTERIEARTSPAVRKMIEEAAMLEGRSLSDFVISMASEGARKTIQEYNQLKLSSADQLAFAESLLDPKPAPAALAQAMQHHADLIEPS